MLCWASLFVWSIWVIFTAHTAGEDLKRVLIRGYCYPCFTKLPQCDTCIMSPEKCHYEQGTCRDPSWGEEYCFTDHYVYLANSSGVKVGITRGSQVPTRWIDREQHRRCQYFGLSPVIRRVLLKAPARAYSR